MAKLASRYATALYELAKEKNATEAYLEQVSVLNEAVCKDSEIMEFINNPNMASEEKFSLFEKVFKGNIDDDIIGLISVIFSKNRQKELPLIFNTFTDMVKESHGIVVAYVESAIRLNEKQLEEIKHKLADNLGKQIVIKARVDESLIGGLKISVDGHVIDGSIKKSIENLKKFLLKNKLA